MKTKIIDEQVLEDGSVVLTIASPFLEVASVLDKCESQLALRGGLKEGASRADLEARYGKGNLDTLVCDWLMQDLGGKVIGARQCSLAGRPEFSLVKNGYPEGDFLFESRLFELPKGALSSVDPVAVAACDLRISDEEIDERIKALALQRAKRYDTDIIRPVEYDDVVKLDVEIKAGGAVVPRLSRNETYLRVVASAMPESFIDEVVGMVPGETKSFVFLAPKPNAAFDGEIDSYEAKVTILCLCDMATPKITDAWVAGNFPGISTTADLRLAISDSVDSAQKLDDAVDAALVERLDVELSDSLVDFVASGMFRDCRASFNSQGMSMKAFCSVRGCTEEEYMLEVMEGARKSVMRDIALDELFKAKGFVLSREDIDRVFDLLAEEESGLSMKRDFVLSGRMHLVEEIARREKAHAWLVETAIVR